MPFFKDDKFMLNSKKIYKNNYLNKTITLNNQINNKFLKLNINN